MAEQQGPTAEQQRKAQAAAWATSQVGSQQWNWWCQLFAEQAYGTRGRYPSALAGGNTLLDADARKRALAGAEPGDLVFFSADDTNNGYGHVGIYVGGDRMVSATPNGVKETSITKDSYYGPRFRGTAAPPADWKGQPSTPALQAGATKILAAVGSGATGDKAVSQSGNQPQESRALATMRQQRQTAQQDIPNQQAALQSAQDALLALRSPYDSQGKPQSPPLVDTPAGERYKAREAQLEADVKRAQEALAGLRKTVNDLDTKIATAEDTATGATGADAKAPEVRNFGSAAAPDWRQYDAASGGWRPIGGLNAPPTPEPKARRTQVVNGRLIDLDTGQEISTIPEAPLTATGQVQLDTARVQLEQARLALENARDPLTRMNAQLTYDTAKFKYDQAVQEANRPTAVNVPASQEQITQYNPTTGQYEAVANPAYRAPAPEVFQPGSAPVITQRDPRTGAISSQPNTAYAPQLPAQADAIAAYTQQVAAVRAQAERYRDQLLSWQEAGSVRPERATELWAQHKADAEAQLAGARSAAEQRQRTLKIEQRERETREATRVEDINRQREAVGVQAGQQAWSDIAKAAPGVRSEAFLQESAENRARFASGQPMQYSAAAVNPAEYARVIPSREGIVSRAVAEALQYISPAAARAVGAPVPSLSPAVDVNALLAGLGGIGGIPLPGVPGGGAAGAAGLPDLIETRQAGGPVQPGQAYLVGERGPELLQTTAPGTVVPLAPAAPVGRVGRTPAAQWMNAFARQSPQQQFQDLVAGIPGGDVTEALRQRLPGRLG